MNLPKKIAVIGDIIIDEFVFGSVDRINPEAPVPVLRYGKNEFRLGGAANVAHNVVSLGGNCILIGKVGNEKTAENLLDKNNIEHDLLIDSEYHTIVKTRFLTGDYQLLRLDKEKIKQISQEEVNQIAEKASECEIIIISDYAKGLVSQELMDELRKTNKTILVDPKISKTNLFKDVYLIKPNLEETKKILRIDTDHEHELEESALELQNRFNANILITKGKDGMSLFEKKQLPYHIPSQAKEVYDVTGAGDTVIATIGYGLSIGKSLKESVELANRAAGIVVGKVGTAAVKNAELKLFV